MLQLFRTALGGGVVIAACSMQFVLPKKITAVSPTREAGLVQIPEALTDPTRFDSDPKRDAV